MVRPTARQLAAMRAIRDGRWREADSRVITALVKRGLVLANDPFVPRLTSLGEDVLTDCHPSDEWRPSNEELEAIGRWLDRVESDVPVLMATGDDALDRAVNKITLAIQTARSTLMNVANDRIARAKASSR